LDAVGALAFLTAPAERGGEGLPPHAVALLGHSLGGGVAPEAAAFFPGVTVISDRSFSRLSAAAGGLFLLDAPPWARALLRFVMARFACWEYDAIRHWRALPPETPKIVAFEPADEVIRGPAQLHSELRGKGFVPAPPAAREEVGAVCALESLRFPHNRPFTDGEMARLATVMNAVMREPQVGSSGGLWRPGLPAAF
jgi:pimeloyl-ACP methyl ester carboxylesterase